MYQEGAGSTFTHNGKEYPLDPFLKRAAKLPVKQVPMDRLMWNLDYGTPDPERVAKADTSVPMLYTIDPRWGYTIIDGFHRLAKGVQEHKRYLPGREIPKSWFLEISMEEAENYYTVGKVTREQAFEWLAANQQSRPEPFNEGAMNYAGANEDRVYAFAYHRDVVVGYASLLNGQRYLIDMYVPESLRGQGIGRQLIDSLLVDLVVVRKHQTDIIAFLVATGFTLENDFVNARVYRKYHGPVVHAY